MIRRWLIQPTMDIAYERKLVRLVHKFFLAGTVEEWIQLIGSNVSPIKKKIGEMVLCFHSAYFGPRQYCLKGKRLFERTAKSFWPKVTTAGTFSKQESLYLANELGRPFYNIFAIPLDSSYELEDHPPVLFIEYFCKTETIENFFSKEKQEILKSAFSKVLLEEHWKSGSDLWQQTFDGLEEPLAILNKSKEPIRSNTHFQRIYKKNPSLFLKEHFQDEEKQYEKQSYPIVNNDQTYIIEHFTNVTSYLLLREQIAQNQKMSSLGKLANDVAHLLSNPLTGIRSMAQILSEEVRNKDNFLEIERAAHRCQKIITNFIQFSRQTNKNLTCDLNKVVHQTLPFLKTMIQTKKILLDLDKQKILVQAEPCLLQQVIFNLVRNALQAVGEKGQVCIQTCIDKSKNQVQLSVQDNGCGIPQNLQDKIFDPFFTTKSDGTGLGLRISYQVIKKFGGQLQVQSKSGEGSCFTISLPLVRKENENFNY